jgi:hypothetical protein
MKCWSLVQLGISPKRLFAVALSFGLVCTVFFRMVTGDVLGEAGIEFDLVVLALAFYLVVSTPRRLVEAARAAQAREAVSSSVLVAALSRVTGSKSRTVLMMSPKEESLSSAVADAKRSILLGTAVDDALTEASRRLASTSAATALRNMGTLSLAPSDAGEEALGLATTEQLSRETKLPIFMTVCFFSPVMLLLYALFSHQTSLLSLAELIGLQLVILDLSFHLCSGERGSP